MRIIPLLLLTLLLPFHLGAQDTDHDGLSDALEQSLLDQFAPTFLADQNDCSNIPAQFTPGLSKPTVLRENGTIYGQVFPKNASYTEVEVHFYHLWRRDCGEHGHPLDTEHVAALLRQQPSGGWSAAYWYAAAHELTVCDVSQIARASTLKAEDHGATIWISAGKHGSYLNELLCHSGCGADRCDRMRPVPHAPIINLGEPSHPMNGSVFAASAEWPLTSKMQHTNFPDDPVARLETLPVTSIAWFAPGKHPVQGIIRHSASTENAIASGGDATADTLARANARFGIALDTAQISTGNALQKSFRNTRHAVATAAKKTTHALGASPKADTPHQAPR